MVSLYLKRHLFHVTIADIYALIPDLTIPAILELTGFKGDMTSVMWHLIPLSALFFNSGQDLMQTIQESVDTNFIFSSTLRKKNIIGSYLSLKKKNHYRDWWKIVTQ